MHSSRMRTARLLTYPGGSASGGLHPGVCLGVLYPGGSASRGGSAHPAQVCLQAAPVNRMTHKCKNITLPQTSVVDSNNK